ncbi:hypothetical protein ANCCAN_16862 [Ancylostoma caninum]|uniref:Uncharacterized protein n=1 Tax=Ancylostoma caninum TaxID=29170 RepID=A0A368G1W0_ANCCA|nr:hypothetical protein ANCCAN_16862 [Ancylostoma caninum]
MLKAAAEAATLKEDPAVVDTRPVELMAVAKVLVAAKLLELPRAVELTMTKQLPAEAVARSTRAARDSDCGDSQRLTRALWTRTATRYDFERSCDRA